MDDKIALKVVGITHSQVQSGAYALLLGEVDGPYRIPVVVGVGEAQSIATRLENIIPSRPLSHDLMVSMFHAFRIELAEVMIYRFHDGVFCSRIKLVADGTEVELESRTSDAVALALRTGSPIYTTPEVLQHTGFKLDSESGQVQRSVSLADMPLSKLERRLEQAVQAERYELAAKIQKIINERKATGTTDQGSGDLNAEK